MTGVPIIGIDDSTIVTLCRGRVWGFSLRTAELQDYLFDVRWKRWRLCRPDDEM